MVLTPIPSNSGCTMDKTDNSCGNNTVSCKNTTSDLSHKLYTVSK